jgi:hypothetical protein
LICDSVDYLTKDLANSNLANLNKLIANHVDLVVIDRFVARYLLKKTMMAFINDIEPIEPVLMRQKVHPMFSKSVEGYQLKVTDFNWALTLITADKRCKKSSSSMDLTRVCITPNDHDRPLWPDTRSCRPD